MRRIKKNVVLTGASSGIGKALAWELARRGASLTLLSRRAQQLGEVAEAIRDAMPDAPAPLAVPCDVRDRVAIRRALHEAEQAHGPAEILINNAGVSLYGGAEECALEDLRRVMEINYFGAVTTTLETLPAMRRAGRGVVVNVASVAALYGVPFLAGYGASKAALASFSQSVRAELRGTGIRVLVVYPGYTDTELFDKERVTGGTRRPRTRYASSDSVARAIVRAILGKQHELVLTLSGNALQRARALGPGLIDFTMGRMAHRLRTEKGENHGHA